MSIPITQDEIDERNNELVEEYARTLRRSKKSHQTYFDQIKEYELDDCFLFMDTEL